MLIFGGSIICMITRAHFNLTIRGEIDTRCRVNQGVLLMILIWTIYIRMCLEVVNTPIQTGIHECRGPFTLDKRQKEWATQALFGNETETNATRKSRHGMVRYLLQCRMTSMARLQKSGFIFFFTFVYKRQGTKQLVRQPNPTPCQCYHK